MKKAGPTIASHPVLRWMRKAIRFSITCRPVSSSPRPTEFNPQKKNAVRMQYANFLFNQFGVQTMAYYGWRFGRMQTDDTKDESGTYALHTLGEDETIARLATGVKRFKLPDEFNFIKVYQKIVEEPQTGFAEQALVQLAGIFENRRQYPKARSTTSGVCARSKATGAGLSRSPASRPARAPRWNSASATDM